jgi:glycosyltransferase involved in cell wall biosynthesis
VPSGDPGVTVAIVVKNRKDLIARCLDAVEAQADVDFDILVVDNGSTDGTLEYLVDRAAASSRPMTVMQEPGSLGRIRNAALREARGDIIAFTDSDCVPSPGWLRTGLDAFSDDVAVVQGRTVPARQAGSFEATINIPSFSHRYETCNIFYDRVALAEVGGFGEDMPQIGEDMVAGWRIRRSGRDAVWAGDAVVTHDVTYPPIRWWVQRGWRYECWPQFIRQFPEARSTLLYRGFLLNRRQFAVIAAAAGVGCAAATLDPRPLAAAVPLIWRWRPLPSRGRTVRNSLCALAFDAASLAGLIRGSIKNRTVVL